MSRPGARFFPAIPSPRPTATASWSRDACGRSRGAAFGPLRLGALTLAELTRLFLDFQSDLLLRPWGLRAAAVGAMDALALPCDELDDGAVDDSCG